MKKYILPIITLLILTTSSLVADSNLVPETITQKGFLNRLIDSHPFFEREQLTAQIEQQKRNSYLGSRDWNMSSSIFISHDEPSFVVAGPEQTDAVTIGGGLQKNIWSTGGRLLASFTSTYADLDIDPFLGIPGSYFENELAVTYSHPLLRNKKGELDRLQYELSQFDIDISEVISKENEENFLLHSADKYLDWVLLEEQHKIIVERLRLSEEELQRTKEKRDANLIDEVDVIRAEDAVRITRQNLLLIKSQINALKSELAILINDESLLILDPAFNLYMIESFPLPIHLREIIKSNSRLLKALEIRIRQQKRLSVGYKNQGKADLSLIGQLGFRNAEYSYGRSLVTDKPNAMIGLKLGFPVGQRKAKANVTQTELQIMQIEKQMEEILIDIVSASVNLATRAKELESVLKLNLEQIDSADKKTQEELKLYNQGRGELTFVIQSRDSEQAAKLTYAINAMTYHKLILQLNALTDQLHN